ncbi:MAG: glutamate-5-semialdehyde dehydrogenase [Parachlamydiales bacterium]|nr:glutamate-5-semialdehyde dehydrogenase [Candidatus Acheromyda pituitae]
MTLDIRKMAAGSKKAAFHLARASSKQKGRALTALMEHLMQEEESILKANAQDLVLAKEKGLEKPLLERLSLENRLRGIIHDIEQVLLLPDPIGAVFEQEVLPNGLKLEKCRVPIGVLGVIYESRPNVTLDISALSIKSGNCALLRGGSEALRTNLKLVELIQRSLLDAGLSEEAVQLVADTDRSVVKQMLQLDEYIDLIIPRGSSSLQRFCKENSTIPVIMGGAGICHLFVDESADLEASIKVIANAKTQRPTVCNALDTLLVHATVAPDLIPELVKRLSPQGVSFRLDPAAMELAQGPSCQMAGPQDWDTEWLSLVLGVKVVGKLSEAIDHVQEHSSGHSDGILTRNQENAEQFVRAVDSAAVYVNASTRFTDGGQFGLGAEVAISTQKFHARGPMGLKELTSYKWVVRGDYQVRS